MHMIIVGCGRVGSTVGRQLDTAGHDVVVIDRKSDAFRRLGDSFGGRTMTGVGFDRDVLTSAGITRDSAVMAVTSGDNSNILIARVAREMFGVERVVARIYDPKRAQIYARLGISTVATVSWTSNRIMRAVLPDTGMADWSDPTSTYNLVERRISATHAGKTVSSVPAHVALLLRNGKAEVPSPNTVLQDSDVVQLMATSAQVQAFDSGHDTGGGNH